MKKKNFLTIAGVLTAIMAISNSAMACHLFSKKNTEQKDSDPKNKENQNIIKEENDKKEYIEMKTMYGIPLDFDKKLQNNNYNEDIIIIKKYAIPSEPDKDIQVLKYAVPKEIRKPKINNDPPVAKYALPQYMDNPPVEKYAVPNIDKYPLLKYATPYFPTEKTIDTNTENNDKNPWK